MNKKFLKHYMETNPEGTAQTYIFLVDNQDIALNIVMSGYQALCLVQEDDGYYFSADSFIEEMRAIQFTGSCQCAYHYVVSCTVKWVNDKLLTFFKDAGLDGKAGWQLFKEKEYLGKLDNQKEVEKLLEQYILRFERDPKEEPELSRFHLFDAKGNVKGVRDMEIVDYLVENVQFFVVGITPYYYEHGMYYQIGEEHKEFCAEKTQDEDYYVLTLAAIARELDGKGMNRATVHIAAGLPLTWVATQKEDFQKYLLQNESVDFIFRNKEYHVEFAGADIYPQGFAAAFYRLQDFKGINMLVDIGNGTMNIMYINNSRPLEKKCFTEKYGTHQCVLAVRESLLKELGTVVDDLVIEQVIRTGTADIGEKYLTVIRKAAGDYTKEIFHKLREREYNPELMRLYVVGGGGCMIQNFGEYDKSRVTIVRDICAAAKGYEAMTVRKIQRNGGMLV